MKFFSFLRSVVDISSLYRLIKSRMEWIINSVLPVALSITREERALYVDDPIQFVNQVYDVSLDACLGLLILFLLFLLLLSFIFLGLL